MFACRTFPQRWWGSCVVLSAISGAQHASHCFATVLSTSVFPKHCVSRRWTQIWDTPLAKHFLISMKNFSCVCQRLFLQCNIHSPINISFSFLFYFIIILKIEGFGFVYFLSVCPFCLLSVLSFNMSINMSFYQLSVSLSVSIYLSIYHSFKIYYNTTSLYA